MAISEAIGLASGNKTAAARILQVDLKTLYTKLRRYDLEIPVTPNASPSGLKRPPIGVRSS